MGLLDGAHDISRVRYFAKDMTSEACKEIFHDRHVVFNHILKDVNNNWRNIEPYLSTAHCTMRDFLYSGEVANRKNLKFVLNSLADTRGQFMIILGSKGLGKSAMLKEIEKRHCERIFRIDMRQNKDLVSGLMGALKMQYSYQQKSVRSVITSIVQGLTMLLREYTSLKDKKLTEKVTEEKNTLSFVLHQMISQFGHITIIIDEANLPFSKPYIHDEKDMAQAKATLELFTALTKQDKQMNVVLVSSNHDFPAQLAADPLFFDVHSFTQIVYMHELDPKDMYQLLTETCRVGHHLATMLISCHGGDVDAMYQALYRLDLIAKYHSTVERGIDMDSDPDDSSMLRQELINFPMINAHHAQAVQTVVRQCREQGLDTGALREILGTLARQGYVLIEGLDQSSRDLLPLLMQQQVAYWLSRSSQHVGSYSLLELEVGSASAQGSTMQLDLQTRTSDHTMLLPYKQATRLVILQALEQWVDD
eukprot:gene42041-51325_t